MRALLYAVALACAFALGPRGPVYWDGFDYVVHAVRDRPGGLVLGRPLFVLVSHALLFAWKSCGGSIFAAERLLRFAWTLVACLAVPATFDLARVCTLSRRGSLLAAFLLATSPAFAHTSHQVLTDGPSLAFATLALALAARAVAPVVSLRHALAAGALLGLATGIREPSIVTALSFALLVPLAPRHSRVSLSLVFATGIALTCVPPVLYYLARYPDWYPHQLPDYLRAMARERARTPWQPRDLLAWALWLFALSPLALVAAARTWRSPPRAARAPSIAFAVCVPALVQLALFAFYQDIAFSPRYLLACFPAAVCIPAAWQLDRAVSNRPGYLQVFLALAVLPALVAVPFLRARERPLRAVLDDLPARLAALPRRTVIVTGQACPAIYLHETLDRAANHTPPSVPLRFERICPGWSWPDDLPARLDGVLAQHRMLVLDLRTDAWPGARQQTDLAALRTYARDHAGSVIEWQ